MLLRKLMVVLCPLLLCLFICAIFRWLDGLMSESAFLLFALKGLLLGTCARLLLPVAGISAYSKGLTSWLYAAAAVLLLLLLYQYLEFVRVLPWTAPQTLLSPNGQNILVESTVMGFILLTAALNPKTKETD